MGPCDQCTALRADMPGDGRGDAVVGRNPAGRRNRMAADGKSPGPKDHTASYGNPAIDPVDRPEVDTHRQRCADTSELPRDRDSRPAAIEDTRLPNSARNGKTSECSIAGPPPECPATKPDATTAPAESAGRGSSVDRPGDTAMVVYTAVVVRPRENRQTPVPLPGPSREGRPWRWQSTIPAAVACASQKVSR